MWLIILSDQLPIIALVGRYPTNKLIGRKLIPDRHIPKDTSLIIRRCRRKIVCGISVSFETLFPSQGQIAYALLTRSPLSSRSLRPKLPFTGFSFDLHA